MSFRVFVAAAFASGTAAAQDPAKIDPRGAPPDDAAALAPAPKAPLDVPVIDEPQRKTVATISAGSLFSTGNSRLLAVTANGTFEIRRDENGFGAALLANYGQGAPAGQAQAVQVTAENIQGRVRYDRYLVARASVFLINTVRHDRFQGLDVRYNLDPGFKYLFINDDKSALWAEAGYDFQYDVRRNDARAVLDANSQPVLDANGQPVLLSKTSTDHSSRLFLGFRHAFNKEVTFSTGVEYLQSFVDSTNYRVNANAIFAAKVGGGLAIGFGIDARYDHAPLPGKRDLDTATTLSLIYSYSEVVEASPTATVPSDAPVPAGSNASPVTPAPPTGVAPPPQPPQTATSPSDTPAPSAPQNPTP